MITRIEALSYRCLRYVSQPLDRFHVLIGPNASGKTTFLDVVAFPGRLVSGGLDEAVGERTQNFQDLVWDRAGDSFELAVELEIPSWMASDGTLRLLTLTLLAYLDGFQGIYLDRGAGERHPSPCRLCLAKDDEGATDVVLGSDHPALRDWRRDPSLSVLFAAGVLG